MISWIYGSYNTSIVKNSEETYNRKGELIERKNLILYGHNSEQCWTKDTFIYYKESNLVVSKNIDLTCDHGIDSTYFLYNSDKLLQKKQIYDNGIIDHSILYIYDKQKRVIETQKLWYDTVLSYTQKFEFIKGDTVLVKTLNSDDTAETLVSIYYYDKMGRKKGSEAVYSNGKKEKYVHYNYDSQGKLIEITSGDEWIHYKFTYQTY